MRSLSILLLMILALFVGGPAAAQQPIDVDSLVVQQDGSILVEQGGERYIIQAPNQRPNDRRPAIRLRSGSDGEQYIPPYHGYSQMVRPQRQHGGPEGLAPWVTQNRFQPGTVRRYPQGPQGLDRSVVLNDDQPGTIRRTPEGPQGLDRDVVLNDDQPGTVKPDGDGRPQGFTRDQVDFDQEPQRRQRVTRGERTVYDRCPYHPSSSLARGDPRC